ncbi:MAG TPA: hypothetical protein VER03_02295 [Bryobacteraceae bacterium]|nr:hypothetical protein [Bryobacteraceae bacterium]
MEDTLTQSYNSEKQGSGIGNLTNQASGIIDRARDAAGQYVDNDPKAHPKPEHREGALARAIEQQTAKLPSDTFLWAAVGSMGLSLALELMGEEKKANFVGHWAPTLLIFGLYNKLVKLQGSDGV